MPPYGELATTLGIALVTAVLAMCAAQAAGLERMRAWGTSAPVLRLLRFSPYILILVFVVVDAALQLGKYESYNLYGGDFALFDQLVWNTMHGRLYMNTVLADIPIILGQHFSLILAALVPLYGLVSDPRILVVTPVAVAGLTAVLLYWFARRQVGAPLAFVIVAAFLLSPGLERMALNQFYEIMLAMPVVLLAMTFLLQRQYSRFFVCLAVLFISKEDIPLIAAALGLYILIVQRKYVLGGALVVAGVAWFILLIQYIMPHFQGTSSYFYFQEGGYGNGQYSYLGSSLAEMLKTMLTRPDYVLAHVFEDSKVDTMLKLIVPLGLLPFMAPEVMLLALPTLTYVMLSEEPKFALGTHHYSLVFPFLMLAIVVGIRRISRWAERRYAARATLSFRIAAGVFLLVVSVSNYYLYSTGPFSRDFPAARYTPDAHSALASSLAGMIPPDAAVAAQMELLPHVAEREEIYMPPGIRCLSTADYVFADKSRPWYDYNKGWWDYALSAPYFETVVDRDGLVLKKKSPLPSLAQGSQLQFGDGMTLLSYSVPTTQTVSGGQQLHVLLAWSKDLNAPKRYDIRLEVTDLKDHLWARRYSAPCQSTRASPSGAAMVTDDLSLDLPPTMPTGTYRIGLSVFDRDREQFLDIKDPSRPEASSEYTIASLQVDKNKNSIAANQLPIEQPLFVDMREIRFLGFVPSRQSLRPGELYQVGLYWRARGTPQGDYVVALQFRGSEGDVAFEQASRPVNGAYPTTEWAVGEVLLDWHDLTLPDSMIPGDYEVVVVLRDAITGQAIGEAAVSSVAVMP